MDTVTSELRQRLAPSTRDGFPVMRGYLPVVGHMPLLYRGAVATLQRAEREQGPFVQVDRGFGRWLLFCFGADMFELLRNRAVVLAGARARLDYLVGRSLVSLDGAPHKHVRSAVNPTFSARGLADSTAAGLTLETVQRHARAFVDAGGGDAHSHMQSMALDVIFRLVGVEVHALEEWRKQYRRALWGLVPIPLEGRGTPRYFALQATAWIDRELRSLIRRAIAEGGSSVVHALVRARDEEGQPLEEDELVANLRLLFLAGHETTATTMAFAVARLAELPDVVRRLQEEVAAAGGEPPRSIADAKKLPLCEGVFREAARLYGPAWVLERKLSEDITVRGTRLPAGTAIALCPPLWGRDPALYPDPDRFDPDRWLGKPSTPTPYEMAQFGGGAHFCLGYHLTWLESVQYVAALAGALAATKKRLRLAGRAPGVVYYPLPRPSPAARVVVD